MEYFGVFNQVLTLFLLVCAGYAARRSGVIDDAMTTGTCRFLVNCALPALIISSMMVPFSADLLSACGGMLVITGIFYGVSLVIALLLPLLIRAPLAEQGTYAFLLLFSNTGFMGFPVVQTIFGDEGLFYAAIFNLPFNLLVFSVGIILLTRHRGGDEGRFDPVILLNPGIIAVLIGFLIFVIPISLPVAVSGAVTALGSVTTPLSMIVIGAMLARIEPSEIFAGWRVYVVSGARLLLLPLVVWAVLSPFIHDPYLLGIPVVMAAMPAAANAAILAEEYRADTQLASQGVFISTLFCTLTIPFVAVLLV
ncbi:AEC family transporter [Methanofollis fontis]|uniref:AEC family transporter n=1 Tax=Methanofollis fontis TaxID=2052832 RepID=A0A483CR06_9EURY|nr:AEC family transporter [Methanofollis fontis]TAJ45248.1 AEC family transporter [Methanofollis fontis]